VLEEEKPELAAIEVALSGIGDASALTDRPHQVAAHKEITDMQTSVRTIVHRIAKQRRRPRPPNGVKPHND